VCGEGPTSAKMMWLVCVGVRGLFDLIKHINECGQSTGVGDGRGEIHCSVHEQAGVSLNDIDSDERAGTALAHRPDTSPLSTGSLAATLTV
jgi:hypothetical protein